VHIYTVEVVEHDDRGYPSRWLVRRADAPSARMAVVDRDPGAAGEPLRRDDAALVTVVLDRTGEVVSMETVSLDDSLQTAFDMLRSADHA
jgi:hypothetical protein